MKNHVLENLKPREVEDLIKRKAGESESTVASVRMIIDEVSRRGDDAVRQFTGKFDGVQLENFRVTQKEFEEAERSVRSDVKAAIVSASRNIGAFHKAQIPAVIEVETQPGVACRREWRAIERVGLYVPGGTAPLISTVMMLGIPAKLAGCQEIVLCTPPMKSGSVSPAILVAAKSVGITSVFKAGGAQAIAAMAIGTETIPKVKKIFGPGNSYVTAAKALVSQPPLNVAIDLLAGPTELLIIADETANPRWVAADLLSQAEHGRDSCVVLVTNSGTLPDAVERECETQVSRLPRKDIIRTVLETGFSLVVRDIDEVVGFANRYAPEHLILACNRAGTLIPQISNAGSVFIDPLSSVVFGDYASGTNHTLPTGGGANVAGGVTVESFMKPIFFQTVNGEGLASLSSAVKSLARAEGLEAHAQAVEIREGTI